MQFPLPVPRRTADVAFPALRVGVFVHGCFWHGCPDHRVAPVRNGAWWATKVERVVSRDEETRRHLEDVGWRVIVVWEHEDVEAAAARVATIVDERRRRAGG